MKKFNIIVILFFSLFVMLILSGCSVKDDNHDASVSHTSYPDEIIYFSEQDVEQLSEILNSDGWRSGITKTICNCLFTIDDTNLEYSYESGLFRDEDNNRTLFLTDDQKNYVNSLVDDLYGIKRGNYVPSKLDEVYEIRTETVYSTEKTIGESSVIKFNGIDYDMKYERTLFYPVDNIKVHKYTVDGDDDAVVLFNDEGSLFAFMNAKFGKIRVADGSKGDVFDDITKSFGEWIDVFKYDSVKIDGPLSDVLLGFGSYKITLYNMIQGYATDCLTMYVDADGAVTDLWHAEKGIAKEDVSIEIDKTLVDIFLDKKVYRMYSSRETEVRGYCVETLPELKKYNDEICAFYILECGLYDKTADKEYVEKCKLSIPIRLLAKDN